MEKKVLLLVLGLGMILAGSSPAGAMIVINEILADPPVGLAGDANADGVGSSTQDEFVELFNNHSGSVDLSGWSISDATKTRHVFPSSTILGAKEIIVVFGGGVPDLPGVNWQTASTGTLSLNNTGETVSVFDDQLNLVDQVSYDDQGNNDQSIVRSPEGTGADFIQHLALPGADGRRFSAGVLISPPHQEAQNPMTVPEPVTLLSLGAGLPLAFRLRRRKD